MSDGAVLEIDRTGSPEIPLKPTKFLLRTPAISTSSSAPPVITLNKSSTKQPQLIFRIPKGILSSVRSKEQNLEKHVLNHQEKPKIVPHSPEFKAPDSPHVAVKLPTISVENSSPSGTLLECRHRLIGHSRGVSALRFHPNGKTLCSAGADRCIMFWDVENGLLSKQLIAHTQGLNDINFSGDGRFLVSGSDDTRIKIWDFAQMQSLGSLRGHKTAVFSCSWNVQGNMIVSGGQDGGLMMWDVRSGKAVRGQPAAHFDPISSVECHRDGSIVLSASTDGLCRIWDISTGNLLKTLVEQNNPSVGHARFSPNGRYILVAHINGQITIKDYLRNKVKKSFKGHINESYCIPANFLVKHPGNSNKNSPSVHVISGSEDHKVYLWDMNSGEVLQSLSGHDDIVLATACHPSKFCIASAGLEKDRSVRIWMSPNSLPQNGF